MTREAEWLSSTALAHQPYGLQWSRRASISSILRLGYLATVASMSDLELSRVLRSIWCAATSADPRRWDSSNPAFGQCAVTALLVQDHLGGQLLRTVTSEGSHYWNRLDDGTEIDLTRDQFRGQFDPGPIEVRARQYLLSSEDTARRYRVLRKGLLHALATAV